MNSIINPFMDRGPVHAPALFFGRRIEAKKLVQVIGARVPQCCNLIGERRIGKTSLLNYLSAPGGALLEFNQYLSHPSEDYVFIRTDLSALKDRELNGALFFFRLIFRDLNKIIIEKCKAAGIQAERLAAVFDRYGAAESASEITEFGLTAYLDEVHRLAPAWILVFQLDEADSLIRQGVGALLRSLISDRPVAYLLATRLPLVEIDPEREVSPLFNMMADTLAPGLLMPAESQTMLTAMLAPTGLEFSSDELDFIQDLGGGHPDFTKVAARHVLDAKLEGQRFDRNTLKPIIAADLAPACQGLVDGMAEAELLACDQVNKGERTGNQEVSAARVLKRKGILTGDGIIFSPVFADFVAINKKKPAHPVPCALRFGDGYVACGDRVVRLSPIELKLLQYLHDRDGEVCAREEIHRAVWEAEYTKGDEVKVNITIQRLRQKIAELLPPGMMIEAARGTGYRFVPARENSEW